MLKRASWLAISFCWMLLSELATAQENVQKDLDAWLEIPSNRSGLAIVIGGDVKDRTFITADVKEVLDTNFWGSESPFIRQYRLVPGLYQIILPPTSNSLIKSVEINIQAKTLSILQVFPDTGTAMISRYGKERVFDSNFNKFVGEFFAGDSNVNIDPVELSPYLNVIRVNTDPAWPIKPPK